jgi:hypothetical protein
MLWYAIRRITRGTERIPKHLLRIHMRKIVYKIYIFTIMNVDLPAPGEAVPYAPIIA